MLLCLLYNYTRPLLRLQLLRLKRTSAWRACVRAFVIHTFGWMDGCMYAPIIHFSARSFGCSFASWHKPFRRWMASASLIISDALLNIMDRALPRCVCECMYVRVCVHASVSVCLRVRAFASVCVCECLRVQMLTPPAHSLLRGQMLAPQHSCIRSFGAGAGRGSRPHAPCIRS